MIGLWISFGVNAQTKDKATNLAVFFGKASYYDEYFNGRHTANGEIFSHKLLTAAHPSWPFNTKVKITNLSNLNTVIVRINDRGPFIRGRHIDVSKQAAQTLGFIKSGVVEVKMEILSWGKTKDSTSLAALTKSLPQKTEAKKIAKAEPKRKDKPTSVVSISIADSTKSLAEKLPVKTIVSEPKPKPTTKSELPVSKEKTLISHRIEKSDTVSNLVLAYQPTIVKTEISDTLGLNSVQKTTPIAVIKNASVTNSNKPTANKSSKEITHKSKTPTPSKSGVAEKKSATVNVVPKAGILCANSDSLTGWCVQVGSYGNRSNAERTVKLVTETTHEWACIQEIQRNNLTFYRVVCGKNIENGRALEIKQKLSAKYPDAFVTNYMILLNNSNLSK